MSDVHSSGVFAYLLAASLDAFMCSYVDFVLSKSNGCVVSKNTDKEKYNP